jgi:predicted DNA repair protein MutK
MPKFLIILGYIGTAAMLWVGAEIIAHGLPFLHHPLETLERALGVPALAWIVKVVVLALGGVVLGAIIAQFVTLGQKLFKRPAEKTAH